MPTNTYPESEYFPGLRAGTDLEAALLLLKQQAGESPIASLPIETKTRILAERWLKETPRIFQGGMTVISYGDHLRPIIGDDAFDALKAQGLLVFVV